MQYNYTCVPNAFMDSMDRYNPSVCLVYFAVARQTIGWHKNEDIISISQLQKLTGLSNKPVIKALQILLSDGWLTKKQLGKSILYTINCHHAIEIECEPAQLQDEITSVENTRVNIVNSGESTQSGVTDDVENTQVKTVNSVESTLLEAENDIKTPFNSVESTPLIVEKVHTQKIYKDINIKDIKNKEINNINNHIGENKFSLDSVNLSLYAETDTDFNKIDKIFRAGSEARDGTYYYRDAKEAKNIKLLEARFRAGEDVFIGLVRKYFWMITKSGNDFWMSQPLTPSAFNSHYNRVIAYQPPQKVVQREQIKSEPYNYCMEMLNKYGQYSADDLKFIFRGGVINQEAYDYIMQNRGLLC